MANQEALFAEYNTLRQELIQRIQMNLQFNVAALPIAAGVMAYGIQAQYANAFPVAIVVLLSSLWYTANGTKDIISLGTYLYAIIESKIDGLQWERMGLETRKNEKLFSLKTSYPTTICVYALVSAGCIFFTWRFLQDYHTLNVILYSCIIFILIVSFIIISIYALQVSSKKYYLDSVSQWKKLEENFHSAIATSQAKALHTTEALAQPKDQTDNLPESQPKPHQA